MAERYRMLTPDIHQVVLKGRRLPLLIELLTNSLGSLIFFSVLVPVLLFWAAIPLLYQGSWFENPFHALLSLVPVLLIILLPLVIFVRAVIRVLFGLVFPSSWEFDSHAGEIRRRGRHAFDMDRVAHLRVQPTLEVPPMFHLDVRLRDGSHIALDKSSDLAELRTMAESLASVMKTRILYPDDDDSSGVSDPDRVVFARRRPSISGSIGVIVFFGLWYTLLLPLFVSLLTAGGIGNLFLAAFVLIFIGLPLIGVHRFIRAVKSIFVKEVWEFDRLQRSISINGRTLANFDDIMELRLKTHSSPEGIDHELSLIKHNGKRIVVDWSQDEGTKLGKLADRISRVLELDILRTAK